MTFLSLLQRPLSIHMPSPLQVALAVIVRLLDLQDHRRQLKHLSELDDRMLDDIGLSLADVERQTRIRYWHF